MNIQLNFSVESIDFLLSLLAKLPLEQSYPLWSQIKQTAEQQIGAQQNPEVLEGEIVE